MQSFTYYSPTHVFFGPGVEEQTGCELRKEGAHRVLVHFGGGSVQRSGVLQRVLESLDKAGLYHVELGGVKPNPAVSKVREGIELCRKEKIDWLLAVGGGSVIDSCKAIGLGYGNPELEVWDLFAGKAKATRSTPISSVLTMAAAGSELSDNTVINNEELKQKRGYATDLNRPVSAFLNPGLLQTLPPFQAACGATDILMHTMERYFTNRLGNHLTDGIAEALMKTVVRFGPAFYKNPGDPEAASEIMWAGSLSHNNLTGLGGAKDFATHQLGHELSALFDYSHGATLSAMWGSWARYVAPENPARFAELGQNVFGMTLSPDLAGAEQAIQRVEEFFRSLDMPVTLEALMGRKATEGELSTLATGCSRGGGRTIGTFKTLAHDDILKIYQAANNR